MSSEMDIDTILRKAKKQEREYKWFNAAKSYQQALDRASDRASDQAVSFAAKAWERIGFCYSRASRQAVHLEDFKKLRQLAVEAYRNAAQLFGSEEDLKNQGGSAQCNAIANYMNSWLSSTPLEKRKRLEQSRLFGDRSLKAYENAGDELGYGRMCNDLLACLFENLYVASDWREMISIMEEGKDRANKAIEKLLKLGEKSELLRSYSVGSLLAWYGANVSEQEKERKEFMRRSLSYSEKALELSIEVDNPYYTAMSNWAAALSTLLFTEKAESSIEYAKEMLQQGIIAGDNYLKGVASYVLAFVTNWLILKEGDPEKKKEGHQKIIKYAEDAIRFLQLVSQDFFIAETYWVYTESYSILARDIEADSKEKKAMIEKAVEVGRKGLEHARRSGSQDATGSTLHALSKALHFYSNLETLKDEKRRLLEESLDYREEYNKIVQRAFPFNDWTRGVGKNYKGLIEAELAGIETYKGKKISLLESAISDMEDGLSRCRKVILSRPVPTLIAVVGRFEDWFGSLLDELYILTGDMRILGRAIEVYKDAAERFQEVDLPSRIAESYWKMARDQDLLSEHKKAAANFKNAFTEYKNAAKRIPHFTDFYLDYATYMKAWSEIEEAKFSHRREEYDKAMKHYEKTASILKRSKMWSYMSSNFSAWSLLEHAEDLSRKEKNIESIEVFNKVAELFSEAKKTFRDKLDRIEHTDEKDLVKKLIKTSDIRREYCLGRIALEEAKILDRQGDHLSSSRKYGSATEKFQKAIDAVEHESDRQELRAIVYLCSAWQMMTQAEAEASPNLYLEASKLFEKAREYSFNEKAKLLSLGHSCFCKALEAGTRYEVARDPTLYETATDHLESAANHYVKAGFKIASDYAKATQHLFDAYNYMDIAKKEADPKDKAKYYLLAERYLQTSADSYLNAKHPEKTEQVNRLLERVIGERKLATSLSEILHAPIIASSTETFVIPTPTHEKAVGLERFEHADIQANLILGVKQVHIGKNIELKIELVNTGKEPALLIKMEEIVPKDFVVKEVPEIYSVEDSHLNMKGRLLDPLKIEEVKIILRPLTCGIFPLKPRIVYVDEAGHQMFSVPKPVTIIVFEILSGRIKTGYKDLDNLLFGGIPKDYIVILTSPSCDERDLLIKRFLEVGVKECEVTFYVTINASKVKTLAEEFQSNFYLLTCNPKADEIKSLPNVFNVKGVENLTEISIALTRAFRRLDTSITGPKRACIEIISDILLQHHAVQTRRFLQTELITELKSRSFTTLAVINQKMHTPKEVHTILDLFDGEINIYEKDSGKMLKIKRMYNQRYLESELSLRKEKILN